MKFLTIFSMLLLAFNSLASTFQFGDYQKDAASCLASKECMEHNGQIIDLRSPVARMYDEAFKCDYRIGQCSNNEQLFLLMTDK